MAATLIDGRAEAALLREAVGREVAGLAHRGIRPGLAVILVGADPASNVYVRSKAKATREAGMESFEHRLPADTDGAALLDLIARLNADDRVDGILVQLPLPAAIDADAVIAAIDPAKDVDGFHPVNAGRLATGIGGLVPCTPRGALRLIKVVRGDLAGLEAVVIGRSNIVGKPMAQLLVQEHCTVTIAHSRSVDLPAIVRRADIVVAAVGRPGFVRGAWLKPGATVIDVGINRLENAEGGGRLVGDVAFDEAVAMAGAITPVPGGVGPMTIAYLLRNTLDAARTRRGLPPAPDPFAT